MAIKFILMVRWCRVRSRGACSLSTSRDLTRRSCSLDDSLHTGEQAGTDATGTVSTRTRTHACIYVLFFRVVVRACLLLLTRLCVPLPLLPPPPPPPLCRYYDYLTIAEKSSLEGEIIRKCLARSEQQCSFLEYRNYKCIYRRYASLFFIVGVDSDEVRRARTTDKQERDDTS